MLESFAFTLYLIVLLWSPLAFGAVHVTAYTFLVLGTLAYLKNLSPETGSDLKRMREHIRRNVWVHYPDKSFVKRLVE